MPTTAPAIRTKTNTRVIPFLRSAFSPKKCPALKRKPIKKMTPRMMGKMVRMVSETSLTESSIPPICAISEFEINSKKRVTNSDFLISKVFWIRWFLILEKYYEGYLKQLIFRYLWIKYVFVLIVINWWELELTCRKERISHVNNSILTGANGGKKSHLEYDVSKTNNFSLA